MRDDEAILMPGHAPRPALRPADRAAGRGHGRRYGPTPNEREYSALRQQLSALEHDIAEARARLRQAERLHPRGDREAAPALAEGVRLHPHGGREAAPALAEGVRLHPHGGREAAPALSEGDRVVLRDGGQILIRPVEPGDAPAVRAGFDHLADVSRYRRFLSPIEHLSREQLDYLTHVDHDRHEALGALDPVTGEGLGIARYVRDPQDPTQAEVAIVVADAWHGRGVGAALAELLAERARAGGIERFTARLLIGNLAGRRLLERVAEPIAEREDAGTVRVIARVRR